MAEASQQGRQPRITSSFLAPEERSSCTRGKSERHEAEGWLGASKQASQPCPERLPPAS